MGQPLEHHGSEGGPLSYAMNFGQVTFNHLSSHEPSVTNGVQGYLIGQEVKQ